MGKAVYLTGVPGTGKSTICQAILTSRADVKVFSYSEHLGRHLGIAKSELRGKSASVVMTEAVHAVDAELAEYVADHRLDGSVLVDSHAVTSEDYGYRAVPFKPEVLTAVGFDAVVCLAADPATLAERVAADPASRRVVEVDEIEQAQRLQEGVATAYAVILGVPLYVIDTDRPVTELVATVARILGAVPSA